MCRRAASGDISFSDSFLEMIGSTYSGMNASILGFVSNPQRSVYSNRIATFSASNA